jgi:hypothetical protein
MTDSQNNNNNAVKDEENSPKFVRERAKRIPLHRQTALSEYKREGYVAVWVNDTEGNIEAYKLAGYNPVIGKLDSSNNRSQQENQLGSVVTRVVNRDPKAACTHAVLMEIKKEYWDEAQAEKQLENDRIMASIDPRFHKVAGADYGKMNYEGIAEEQLGRPHK